MFDFIAAADLHITNQRPKNRKDNYLETLLNKFEQILKITTNKTHTNLLIVAGDFFDSPTVSYDTTREVIKLIKKYNVDILTLPGQHDVRYHQSKLKNTPMGVLAASGLVSVKNKTRFDINLVGWEEEPQEESEILVIHTMITEKFGLFPGHDYTNAKTVLKQYPWAKLIISGDNHRPHLVKHKNRYQLNCGSMVRENKDQVDYKPAVWGITIYPEIKISRIPLKIKSSQDVFDFDKIEKEETQEEIKKEAMELINKCIESLMDTDDSASKIQFPKIVQKIIKEIKPKIQVIEKVTEIMEKVQK